ncbi:DUF3662 and FHA domain-containing protein [soil metagenome]
MVMQSLERRLERMVTGVFSRGSRTTIRPIELGRRLVREMDDQRSVDVKGRRVVPNDFTVQLSQADFDSFAEIADVLQTELVEAAREYARSEGYHFMGPVRVELSVDQTQKTGRFEVQGALRQSGASPSAASGASTSGAAGAAATGGGSVVLPSGQRITLGDETVTVGRLSECTVPLNDQNVSRRHAEIRPNRGQFVVVDLGSTNGTMVNGTRIHGETVLSDGDIISFGSTYVRFEAS